MQKFNLAMLALVLIGLVGVVVAIAIKRRIDQRSEFQASRYAYAATIALLAQAASAQTIDCATACTVTVVHEISVPPFNLTIEQGAQIAIAIVAVWLVGYVFRLLSQTLFDGRSTKESE